MGRLYKEGQTADTRRWRRRAGKSAARVGMPSLTFVAAAAADSAAADTQCPDVSLLATFLPFGVYDGCFEESNGDCSHRTAASGGTLKVYNTMDTLRKNDSDMGLKL